jgi:hypothetical protein
MKADPGAGGCQHSRLGSPRLTKADIIKIATRDEARVIPVPGMNGARMMASISSVEMRGPCRVLVWAAVPRVEQSCSLSFLRASRMSCGLSCCKNQPPLSRSGRTTYDEPAGLSVSRHLGVSMVTDRSDQRPIHRSPKETCGELLYVRQHRTRGHSGRDLPSLWGSALPRASGRRAPRFQASGPHQGRVHPPPSWRGRGASPGSPAGRRFPANRQGQAVQRAREREPLTATTTSPPAGLANGGDVATLRTCYLVAVACHARLRTRAPPGVLIVEGSALLKEPWCSTSLSCHPCYPLPQGFVTCGLRCWRGN